MPNVILPNLGIELPDVGSDQDTWGDILNADLTILDTAVQYDAISKTLSNVDVTLTAGEAASAVINLTGTLLANVNVIVPATPVRVYLVRNQTSGAFTVTVKTAAGTGTAVQQGTSSLVYSDGTNIIQGATSVNGSFAVSGALTAGSINSTPIGATTPSTGGFTNLSYTGTLTGGTGVINIGSGQFVKDVAGGIGINVATPTSRLTIGQGTFAAAASGTSGLYTAATGLLTLLADGLDISTRAGVNRFTLDSAGNAGLGVTPNAWGSVFKALDINNGAVSATSGGAYLSYNAYFDNTNWRYKTSTNAGYFSVEGSEHKFFTAPSGTAGNPITFTQAMTLTQGGNLLVGGTADNASRVMITSDAGQPQLRFTDNIEATGFLGNATALATTLHSNGILAFGSGSITFQERGRFTSGGYFKASNTGAYGSAAGLGDNSAGANHWFQSNANDYTTVVVNGNVGAGVVNQVSFLASGSAGKHFEGVTNSVSVYQVLANGNVQNTNNSYGPISDAKLKENIADAPSFLDRFMQLRFVTYNLKESLGYNPEKQLGWVAQEVEQVFPSLVYDNIDTEQVTKTRIVDVPAVLDEKGNEVTPATTREEEYTESVPTGTVTKALKASVISVIQGKVIQEQQAIIQTQQAQIDSILTRLAALETKVGA